MGWSTPRVIKNVHQLADSATARRHDDDESVTMREFWNANTHYHGLVLAALPPGATRVLDVGCGGDLLLGHSQNMVNLKRTSSQPRPPSLELGKTATFPNSFFASFKNRAILSQCSLPFA